MTNDDADRIAASAVGGDLADMPKGYYTNWRFIGSVAAVSFMAQGLYLGYILPANTMGIINADVGPNPNYVLIPTVKTLCTGVGMTLVGRLSDIFGRRWFMIVGCLLGMLGSIINATAQNIPTIIGGTVFVGVAGAVQTGFSFVLMELVANKHRPAITAFLFLTTLPFAAFGPLLARALAGYTELSWRWNYYLNLITQGIAVLLFYFCYYPPSYSQLHEGKSIRKQLNELDYGGGLHPWSSASVIAPLIIGIVTLAAFAVYEIYVPQKYPLIPMSLFKNGRWLALAGVAAIATMFYYSLTVIWPQMITSLYTSNNIQIGLMSGTVGGPVAFGQVIGALTVRWGWGHWQLRIASIVMCAFIGAMASCDASTRDRGIAATVLGSFAVGVIEVIAIIAIPFTVPPKDLGLASGLLGSCRAVLGSIALAIFSGVLNTTKDKEITPRLRTVAEAEGLSTASTVAIIKAGMASLVSAFTKIPGVTPKNVGKFIKALQDGNVVAYNTVFYASLAFGGASVICAFCTKSFNEHFTATVDRRLQGAGHETKNDQETV
ncbi:MFS general substrate transporter [Cucurbitaria berberidis CBS 394.84]|uniref:MFS general substrate transporter n=1 Tax=Cucurbitaria berberidis CBS 394.84 TaxID=1168544 RepID=A0A9P4GGD1_9PLEO|nr:MFS general substrate transporter [Cucurbitaria berberidis CBS 394.84]KAF1844966.1 MFS general substrate transporter [Cucurbitaria berberidis CBS 394.84]